MYLNMFNLFGLILISINSAIFTQNLSFSSLKCDFDINFYLWSASQSFPMRWTRIISPDHIYRTNISFNGAIAGLFHKGGYIQVYMPNNDVVAPNEDLVSPALMSKTSDDCFSYYYYIHGEGAKNVDLQLESNGANIPLWSQKFSAGDMWHLNMLRFIVSSGYGAVAFANFSTFPGLCAQVTLCDFESGNCNWNVTSNNPNYKFKLVKATDVKWSGSTSAPADHSTELSTGHFMEADGGNINDWTEMISPKSNLVQSRYCLRFWYWRHNPFADEIQVISRFSHAQTGIINNQVWKSNHTFPHHMWHRAQVNVTLGYLRLLVFRATKMATVKSSIEIDDISLRPEPCSPAIDCDFNRDMCGWTRAPETSDWLLDHGIGRLENASVLHHALYYAPVDRSAGLDGMFMYTDFSQMAASGQIGKMVLLSEFVAATTGSCLSFYFLPISITDETATFSIILRDTNDKPIHTAYTYSRKNDPHKDWSSGMLPWTQLNVTIKTPTSVSQSVFRIVLQITSKVPGTYLAIDDITYRTGACSQSSTSTTIQKDTKGTTSSNMESTSKRDVFETTPGEITLFTL